MRSISRAATIALTLALAAHLPAGLADTTEAQADRAETENWMVRTWNNIPHEERDIPWLVGDTTAWSLLASGALLGVAVHEESNDFRRSGLVPFGSSSQPAGDTSQLGDDLRWMVPASAYSATLLARDWQGTLLMLAHNGASSAATQALKNEVGQVRPNAESDSSFPSGHANTAFLGAAFLQQRYGSRWGVPAYVAAIIVAWTRLYNNEHYMNDIVSGAALGQISAWAIVPPYDAERRALWNDLLRERKLRFEWEMTFNDVDKNELQAPRGSGDAFDTPPDEDVNDPWANSHVAFEYRFNRTQSIIANFTPWEIRTFGEFSQPTDFAGFTFPADQELRFAHRLWALGAQYRHRIIDSDRFSIRVGGGLTGMLTEEEIFIVDPTIPNQKGPGSTAQVETFYPVAHADLDLRLFWKLFLSAEADYGTDGDNTYSDWSTRILWRINPKWDVAAGWREFRSKIEEHELNNDFRRSGPAVNIAYAF